MITKLYYKEFVYLYHGDWKLYYILKYIQDYVTNADMVIKWKSGEDMIVILRQEDLEDLINEAESLKQKYIKMYINEIPAGQQKLISRVKFSFQKLADPGFSFRQISEEIPPINYSSNSNFNTSHFNNFPNLLTKNPFNQFGVDYPLLQEKSNRISQNKVFFTSKLDGLDYFVDNKIQQFLKNQEGFINENSPKNKILQIHHQKPPRPHSSKALNIQLVQTQLIVSENQPLEQEQDNQFQKSEEDKEEISFFRQVDEQSSRSLDPEANDINDLNMQLSVTLQKESQKKQYEIEEIEELLPPHPLPLKQRLSYQSPDFPQNVQKDLIIKSQLFYQKREQSLVESTPVFQMRKSVRAQTYKKISVESSTYCDICSLKIEIGEHNIIDSQDVCNECVQNQEINYSLKKQI